MRRRLACILLFALFQLAAAICNAGEPYRLIFNCDGNAVFVDAKGDTEQWLRNLFDPLENSHVDALFWCDGAGGNTANYDSRVLELTGKRSGKVNPHLQRLIDEGNDPPKLVIREARKRNLDVFYSFRINDIHDSFIPGELPTFKVDNPDWMLGKQKYGDVVSFPTALNFAVDEVRELKFRTVKEVFQKYDFDGLEIDFLRSAPYFPSGTTDKNAHLLTDMLRRIRQELAARARQRGRPIRLAVRVDETLRGCKQDGFEVKRWIDEGLIDILILGSGAIDMEVEAFKSLTKGTDVAVYPCLYGWPSKYSPIPRELACATALNYWAQGADGVYLFNWFPHQKNNSESTAKYQRELLKELGDPKEILANERKFLFVADRGRPHSEYPGNWLHCVLPAALPTEKEVTFKVRANGIPEKRTSVQFRLQLDTKVAPSELQVTVNRKRLQLRAGEANSLAATFESSLLKAGDNEVVVRRVVAGAATPTLIAAEARLHYDSPPVRSNR